jgi:hypothetical protein
MFVISQETFESIKKDSLHKSRIGLLFQQHCKVTKFTDGLVGLTSKIVSLIFSFGQYESFLC